MEYEIVEDKQPIFLVRRVQEMIEQGWTPLGGLAVGMMDRGPTLTSIERYMQAMTRPTRYPTTEL